MPNREDVDSQINLVKIHRRNIQQYLTTIGKMGTGTPAHVNTALMDERANVNRIKNILRGWGVDIEDHVDDTAPVFKMESSIPVGTKINIEIDNDNKILVMPKAVYAMFRKAMERDYEFDIAQYVVE